MTNRLSAETSPYLLQHKDNPVDWYPWGEAAFAEARSKNKPIFLSVGYSACHWCHVMAHESFDDVQTAQFLNEKFVSIKVDREERPDVDAIYMNAVQAISGGGGWPMTVFLLPDGRPFFGGTYFPDKPRYGSPSFMQVLTQIARAYDEKLDAVETDAHNLTKAITRNLQLDVESDEHVTDETLHFAFRAIASGFDSANGGFGSAPKFPPAMTLELLLRMHHRFGWHTALEMAITTLDHMAAGGMFDQVGGGFHRYSTDSQWLIPHFEKMLYDNALLIDIYTSAFQVTGSAHYQTIVFQTIDFIKQEMTDPKGGFYSSLDADSEGHEGRYFIWTKDQIRTVLQDEPNRDAVIDYWGLNRNPNFEGAYVLWVPEKLESVAAGYDLTPESLMEAVEKARLLMRSERFARVRPTTDTKILTSWNALMIRALVHAGIIFDRRDFVDDATIAADLILSKMYKGGQLLRSYSDGQTRLSGYLEDYAFMTEALIELYQATFELRWYQIAIELTERIIADFWDAGVGFYDTALGHEKLIVRPQEITDNAMPSGTSSALAVLIRMGLMADRPEWTDKAVRVLRTLTAAIERYPLAFSYTACQLDFLLSNPLEIAFAGDIRDDRMGRLIDAVVKPFRPGKVVAYFDGSTDVTRLIPWLDGKSPIDHLPTVYACQGYVCKAPVTTVKALLEQIDAVK